MQRGCRCVRRWVFQLLTAAFVAQCVLLAAAEAPSRKEVVTEIATHVIRPGYTALRDRSRALSLALKQLAEDPNTSTLSRAKEAWVATELSWKAISVITCGPIRDLELEARFAFRPARPANLENLLARTTELSEATLREEGVLIVSLSALEYLLFNSNHIDPAKRNSATSLDHFTGPASSRRRTLVVLVSQMLEGYANQLLTAWTSATPSSPELPAPGQEGINLLVNDLVAAVEHMITKRLSSVLELDPTDVRDKVWFEGQPSGSSLESLRATIRGIKTLYEGGTGKGIDDLIQSLNPALHQRIRTQFEKIETTIGSLGGNLDQILPKSRDRVTSLIEQLRSLELMLKTDAVSTLGVTLTFISGDGD